MEARLIRTAALAAVLLVCMGARYQSANFIVETSDPRMAAQIGQSAEKHRQELAVAWLGQAMPNWSQPCMMTVQVGAHLGAGGATTFLFDQGEVFGWRMTIQGSAERIVDSVLPHEITHMIYASYFRRPVPRWADEGGATTVEHFSEKQKHRTMLVQFLRTGRGIAFSQMFAMTEYPRDVMPLYAQSHALAEYLILHGGRRKYVEFLSEGMQSGQWSAAIQRHYGIADLAALQNTWVGWVAQGFPAPKPEPTAIAATVTPVSATSPSADAAGRRARPEPNLIYRIRDKGQIAGAPPAGQAAMASLAATKEALMLPPEGWHPMGKPATGATAAVTPPPPPPSPQPTAAAEQVTRPQALEPSRQIILEWSQR